MLSEEDAIGGAAWLERGTENKHVPAVAEKKGVRDKRTEMTQPWYEDPKTLFSGSGALDILPSFGAPVAQQVNAVMRLAVLYGTILAVFRRDPSFLAIPLVAAVVTYIVSERSKSRAAGFRLPASRGGGGGVDDDDCYEPREGNPYMNVVHVEDPRRQEACDPLDPGVVRRVEQLAQPDPAIFRDVDDVWGSETSARRFMTNPVTSVPNNQAAFAEWLYGDMRRSNAKRVRPPAVR